MLFVVVSGCFLGTVHGGAQIVPEKNRESFPLSKDVFWCCLRMLLLAEYWGGCCKNNFRQQFKDKLSYKINEVYQTIISLFLSHDFETLEIMT